MAASLNGVSAKSKIAPIDLHGRSEGFGVQKLRIYAVYG
jgi:hypothetical protein